MNKDQNDKMVPKLRFPEFQNNKQWKEISLIDVANKKIKWSFTGGPFGSNLKASDYVKKGIRVIQLQNIGDGEFIDDYKIFTSVEKADELLSCNIYAEEIILSKMGDPVGRACLIPNANSRYVMCSDGIRLAVDEGQYSKYFIYTLINSQHFRPLVEKTATGSTRKRIGLDELKILPMVVPSDLKEQQKIASCLSSLDDLITAYTQKLATLKNHKKGLMQQLFPAEGEKVPKLRFAEFKDRGEWEEKPLEKLTEKIGDGIHTTPNYDESGEYYFINGNNLVEGRIYVDERTKRVSVEEYEKHQKDLNDRTILLSINGTIGNVAFYNDEMVILGKSACYINTSNELDKIFLYYLLQSDRLNNYFESELTGSTIKNLSLKSIREAIIDFPSKTEQRKIATCLFSLDDLITGQKEKIDQFKKHKKGVIRRIVSPVSTNK